MSSEFVQFVQGAAGESANATVLVALIAGASGAIVGIVAGALGYVGTVRASRNHLEAAKLAAQAQMEAAKSAATAQLDAGKHAASVQLETMKLQLEADTAKLRAAHVTTERLRWLQDLRQRLSHLYRDLDTQVDLLSRAGDEPAVDRGPTQIALDGISDKVMVEIHMISLMLNPETPDQSTLLKSIVDIQEKIGEMFEAGSVSKMQMNAYSEIKTSSFNAMTKIGVTAWKKIQALQ